MRFHDRRVKCQKYLGGKGWIRIGDGRSRTVYSKRTSKDYVLKVPILEEAQKENQREAKLSKKDDRYAQSRLVTIHGVECLLMEYLNPDITRYDLPTWSVHVDCRQVGRDEDGNWKAYDFPDDPLGDISGQFRSHDEIVEIALNKK